MTRTPEPPTCPNCGGHEADSDGDCLRCFEPNIAAAGPNPQCSKVHGTGVITRLSGPLAFRKSACPCTRRARATTAKEVMDDPQATGRAAPRGRGCHR